MTQGFTWLEDRTHDPITLSLDSTEQLKPHQVYGGFFLDRNDLSSNYRTLQSHNDSPNGGRLLSYYLKPSLFSSAT